jgi:hypothetical protein
MKALFVLSGVVVFLMIVLVSHAEPLALSGSSPAMAKQFAKDNSLVPFQSWILPAFGPMQSEIMPELDDYGRPISILNYSISVPNLPESVNGNDSGNETLVIDGVPLLVGIV